MFDKETVNHIRSEIKSFLQCRRMIVTQEVEMILLYQMLMGFFVFCSGKNLFIDD